MFEVVVIGGGVLVAGLAMAVGYEWGYEAAQAEARDEFDRMNDEFDRKTADDETFK